MEEVLIATLEESPPNATRWSRASMAARSGLSRSTVGRIWRRFELKPHLTDRFKLSSDPSAQWGHIIVSLDATTPPMFTQRILLVDAQGRPFSALMGAGVGDVESVTLQL